MNRSLFLLPLALLCALLLLPLGTAVVEAQNFPDYQGFVNDYANLLSMQAKTQLEAQLTQLEKDTTAEVAVVTIKSMDGDYIEDYAVKLFEKWGIGKKEKNNGVLFLVALDDRKMRIEVGYGLEPVITDGRAGRIRDNDVLPRFKQNDYEGGIIAGVNSIEKYIRDGTPPAPLEENPVKNVFEDFGTAFFFMSIITIYLSGFMARSKNIWLGGIWGAVAGGIMGLVIGGIGALIAMPLIFTGLGLGTDYLLSKNYQKQVASGKSTKWHQTWGGFGGFGGGSGGGGFGGFGGGMSGGGGASGGW
ncbi:MAG: TPM domain-containing protein [Dehalococcoidia bacterium]|nr:TPM domain-containing protein [Dehalococcoidia bacterium]MDD5494501.1 TPM domain-containing protein [Dehalococcoidia bacterium]